MRARDRGYLATQLASSEVYGLELGTTRRRLAIRQLRRTLTAALRLLLIAVCVLPLSSPRAVAGFLQPLPVEIGYDSDRPSEEEDESERTDSEARDAGLRSERHLESRQTAIGRLRIPASSRPRFAAAHVPLADPFRNVLGTPYRC